MADDNQRWSLNRQVGVSVIVQLIFLASLIIGTWVNVQKQLYLMQHNIEILGDGQKQFQEKFEKLNNMCIGFEYRLRAVENLSVKTEVRR